ncbi:MAG: disulfide bond formation protein B [Magnetospirillum sp. WYHS-4]
MMRLEKLIPLAILGVCVGALAMAFTAQHVFNLEPCILCIYQRIPYAAGGVLAMVVLAAPLPPALRAGLVALCGIGFLGGAAVAFYHVGVEQHWWISSCGGTPPTAMTLQEMLDQAQVKPRRSCDDVNWSFLGLSMATYNLPFSLAMAVFAFAGAWTMRRA